MKWLALLLVVVGAIATPSLVSDRDEGCDGSFAFSPGPLYVEGYRGADTAEEAVGTRFDDVARTTAEKISRHEREVVVFRGFDADDRLIAKVEIEQRNSGGWYEGSSEVC